MTRQQAVDLVARERKKLGIDRDLKITSAEKAIVEYKQNRDKPGKIEDRIV